MPSHIHMIIGSRGRQLSKIVGEIKSNTSRMLKVAITNHVGESRKEWILWMMKRAGEKNGNNKSWQLWQQHNKPLGILSEGMFFQKSDYIHNNPVEAGFVDKAEEYLYSSARDFYDRKGLVELCYWR